MIKISREMLKDLLGRAYESGWRGVLDLKENAVEELISECADKEEAQSIYVTFGATESSSQEAREQLGDTITSPSWGQWQGRGPLPASEDAFDGF